MEKCIDKENCIVNHFALLVILLLMENLAAILFMSEGLYIIIPLIPMTIVFLVGKDYVEDKIIINAFLVLGLLLWLIADKEFFFMPQAKALLDSNDNLFFWFKNGHIHAIRLLVAYPGYLMSRIFDIELNEGYGYYCILIFTLLFRNMIIIQRNIKENSRLDIRSCYIISGGAVLFLMIAMNGRIIFSFFGLSIIIINNLKLWNGKKISHGIIWLYIIGIIFSTVSSGTMFVSVAVSGLGVLLSCHLRDIFKNKILYLYLVLLSPIAFVFLKYIIAMVNKNIDYFGGGLNGAINMLSHGAGKILLADNTIFFVFIIVCAVWFFFMNLYIMYYIYIKKFKLFPVITALNICLYGLLFGISTGLTSIVSIVTIVSYYADRLVTWDVGLYRRKEC